MRFPQIPNIENVWDSVSIDALSPSTFSWVNRGCGFAVLLQKAVKSFKDNSLSLPSGRSALLGTIIHKIYELTIKGELTSITELKSKWEELITEKKNELASLYPTLRNASLNDYDKRNGAIRYAMGIMRNKRFEPNTRNGCIVLSEKWLDCTEIGLRGKADKLILDNGNVDIVDFKSGQVTDDSGVIKTEYCDQLHLYAAMCQYLSIGTPRRLALVDIDGEYHNVPFSMEHCNLLLSEVKDTLELLNSVVKSKDFMTLAKPKLGMCSICTCRHICKYCEIPADSYYQTISGIVSAIPSTNMYVLQFGNKTYYVSGLNIYNVESPNDYIGKQLSFVNVIRASQTADDYTYRVTENTLVYEQL